MYFLKFSICLAMFWVFYKALLEKESFHGFKRVYLMLSPVFSLLIPLITFTTYVDPVATPVSGIMGTNTEMLPIVENPSANSVNYMPYFLWGAYLTGVLIFGIQFVRNIVDLQGKIRNNHKRNLNGITRVLLQEKISPHTFFNYIFYNRQQLENDEIPEEVHWHEETHAREKHSLDVLLVELLIVFFWFNPVLYLLRKSMKLNHEFLADSFVIRKGISPSQYQNTLLAFTESSSRVSFANAINYSLIKKRFIIMKKQTKKSALLVRLLLTIPMLAILIYSCSEKEVLARQLADSNINSSEAEQDITPTPQDNTPQDVVEAYNQLAKHYNTYPKYDFVTKVRDMINIRKFYDQMTHAQMVEAEPYPKSTTSMSIFITNDGRYLIDEKEVTISFIESVIQKLTKEELSNAYLLKSMSDVSAYTKERGAMNRGMVPPNDIYISVFSDELVNNRLDKFYKNQADERSETKGKIVNHASENEKLAPYLQELVAIFKKYGVNIYE
ncbi:MAG: M56 family metallopeptidase [Bacteroidota bacterium]